MGEEGWGKRGGGRGEGWGRGKRSGNGDRGERE